MAELVERVGRHGDEALEAFNRWCDSAEACTFKTGRRTAAQLLASVRRTYVLWKNNEDAHLDLTPKALATMLKLRAESEPERFDVYDTKPKTYDVAPPPSRPEPVDAFPDPASEKDQAARQFDELMDTFSLHHFIIR